MEYSDRRKWKTNNLVTKNPGFAGTLFHLTKRPLWYVSVGRWWLPPSLLPDSGERSVDVLSFTLHNRKNPRDLVHDRLTRWCTETVSHQSDSSKLFVMSGVSDFMYGRPGSGFLKRLKPTPGRVGGDLLMFTVVYLVFLESQFESDKKSDVFSIPYYFTTNKVRWTKSQLKMCCHLLALF